ncbi:hypothetical protein D3C80_1659400 [compost metagenome]
MLTGEDEGCAVLAGWFPLLLMPAVLPLPVHPASIAAANPVMASTFSRRRPLCKPGSYFICESPSIQVSTLICIR